MSCFQLFARPCAIFALIVSTGPLAGCATMGMSSFKMPIFSEKSTPTASTSRLGGAPTGGSYEAERAYYEQYSRNGNAHQRLKPPAAYSDGNSRHDVVPNEARQQAAFDPNKVGPEPTWHGGTQPVAEAPRTFRVQDGDTIEWIARVHNVSVTDLMRANRLRTAQVYPGQNLLIPTEVSVNPFPVTQERSTQQADATTDPVPYTGPGGLTADGQAYVVEPGDTFYSIAQRNRVDPMKLADLNRIDDTSSIRVGQRLKLPARW